MSEVHTVRTVYMFYMRPVLTPSRAPRRAGAGAAAGRDPRPARGAASSVARARVCVSQVSKPNREPSCADCRPIPTHRTPSVPYRCTLLFAAARSSQEKLWSIFMLYLSFREALRSRPESAANLAATWYASVASRVRWT